MPYTIHFENVAAASAPAQEIVITDQLHANLDWTTFELTQIGFGEQVVDVPAGHAYYQTEVGLGDGLIARVEAGLDIETGLLSTHLVCLDRTTGLFPEDPLAGLLPPNVNPPEGEGWLSFRVAQQPGLADGDVITNQATIVFDVNPPIDTNVVTNTIDDTPPTSTVDPLPAEVTARFEVSWAGDDGDGSGVQSYTIYRAVDGGPFEVWLRNTVETSAMFDGEWGQSYAFCAVARDRAGNREDDPIDGESFTAVQSSSQLRVASLETTPSGLVAYFREPLDAGGLSLYDTAAGTLGPADFTVVGETVGPVAGSLVYDEDAMTVAFIKTGGPLLPDTYSVTLRSAIDGFKASDGRLLDGDGDDVEGGDYVATLTVDPDAAPVISLPDFARGPGQPVDVPATEVGLPIRISDAAGVESVDLTLRYDPARLTITGATVGPEMPSGSMVNVNVTMPGRAVLSVISPAVPDAGEMTLANLIAEVPADAGYGRAQILDLGDVRVNEGGIRAVADDAIHVAAYLGDTNGNGSYGSLDVKGALHAAVGLDGGFPAYPSIDPVVVADVTGNGALSTLDATRILQEVIGLDPAEIPPLPGGGSLETLGVRSAGLLLGPPDAPSSYRVSIPTDLEGAAGQIVTVPIAVEEAEDVEVFDMTVGYDASLLAFEGERVSDLGSIWAVNSGRPGLLVIGVGNPHPLPAGGGTVIELDFVVDASVTPGEGTAVDLESVSLNEGALPLDPTPVDGVDPTDGRITFVQPAFRTLYWNPSGNGIWANDSQWLDGDGNQASDYPDDESTDAVVRTNTVSVVTDCTAHDLTVESGAVEISADAALTLTGDLDVQPLAQYVCQLDGSENGLVEAAGSATLEGTLSLQPTECSGLLPADQWGHQTRTILTAEGGLNGDFANFPDGQPLAENIHLGKGVFLRKGTEAVTYGDTAVEVHLLQAAPGDANGDGQVDMDDIWGIVSAGEYDQGPGPDVDWTVGDFDCNGRVDFDDIWSIVQSGRYDQGPYAATIAEVVAAGASAVDAAPAHDAVFEQVAGRASARHRAVPGKLAWLSDFGQTGARRRPSRRARPMEQAGENMLARCWR
jgi:hypothetical protein